jgi:hypothetical protein
MHNWCHRGVVEKMAASTPDYSDEHVDASHGKTYIYYHFAERVQRNC